MTEDGISAQRFARGLTYSQYLSDTGANREHFERSYQEFQLDPEDEHSFADLNQKRGPIRVLALAEHWCPDVQRGLPVVARIAESAGLDLRVFPRDENQDIMGQYLKEGKYQSIPVFAFFDKGWQPLGHWIERPALATKLMNELRRELAKSKISEEETKAEIRKRVARLWENWRQETVRELRELLAGR